MEYYEVIQNDYTEDSWCRKALIFWSAYIRQENDYHDTISALPSLHLHF